MYKGLAIGNVVRGGKRKYLIRTEAELALAIKDEHEFVCEKPHEDRDFSYLCNSMHCRCCS